MEYVLVSACLLGRNCRYDGGNCDRKELQEQLKEKAVIGFCPECAGGMTTPRHPSEIQAGSGEDVLQGRTRVVTCKGEDVSGPFIAGAERALELCRNRRIQRAYLKEGSPSCGVTCIYDGTFSGKKKQGQGVACALLKENGMEIIGVE